MDGAWNNPYDLEEEADYDITHRAHLGGGVKRGTGRVYDGRAPGGMPRRAIAGFDLGDGIGNVLVLAAVGYVLYRVVFK